MVIHENKDDRSESGIWDLKTGRYVSMSGGSRSLIPEGDGEYPRYPGFVGMDESQTPNVPNMVALFNLLGGGVYIPEGPSGEFISRILEQSKKWIPGGSKNEEEDEYDYENNE